MGYFDGGKDPRESFKDGKAPVDWATPESAYSRLAQPKL
jgi:hypothetical protein